MRASELRDVIVHGAIKAGGQQERGQCIGIRPGGGDLDAGDVIEQDIVQRGTRFHHVDRRHRLATARRVAGGVPLDSEVLWGPVAVIFHQP